MYLNMEIVSIEKKTFEMMLASFSRRPEKQGRRQEAGKMAHGRGGLRAVENQPAHITGVT